jgi:hypothetical protein
MFLRECDAVSCVARLVLALRAENRRRETSLLSFRLGTTRAYPTPAMASLLSPLRTRVYVHCAMSMYGLSPRPVLRLSGARAARTSVHGLPSEIRAWLRNASAAGTDRGRSTRCRRKRKNDRKAPRRILHPLYQ